MSFIHSLEAKKKSTNHIYFNVSIANNEEKDLVLVPWFVRASRSDTARWLVHLPKAQNL